MIEGSTKKNACLPYGLILTLIFREFGVPIPKDEPKRLLHHTDIYCIQSLVRMGFQKINGEWKRMETKKKATEEGESSQPSTSHRRQATPPPTQANPMMHPLDQNQFNQLSEMIQQGFEKLSQQMSQLDTKISKIEDHIQHLDLSRTN